MNSGRHSGVKAATQAVVVRVVFVAVVDDAQRLAAAVDQVEVVLALQANRGIVERVLSTVDDDFVQSHARPEQPVEVLPTFALVAVVQLPLHDASLR